MSDENPVPETLETIAESLRDLRTSMDSRFDDVKSQLRTEIESVRGDVRLVAEGLAAQTTILQRREKVIPPEGGSYRT